MCRREVFCAKQKWIDYISVGVVRQIFYSAAHRQNNLIKVKHPQSSSLDHYIGAMIKLDLSWNWQAVLASQHSQWEIMIAVARIILQAFPFNWRLVKDRFCEVPDFRKCFSRHQFYVNQILGSVMFTVVFKKQVINYIFDIEWSLHCFS